MAEAVLFRASDIFVRATASSVVSSSTRRRKTFSSPPVTFARAPMLMEKKKRPLVVVCMYSLFDPETNRQPATSNTVGLVPVLFHKTVVYEVPNVRPDVL